MTKSMKFNSGNIINIRKSIDEKKKKYWKIIRAENVMSTKEIKAGLGSGNDLKALFNEINQLADKLVYIKGMLFYLNMGVTTFDKEAFKKTNNYNIFMACEMKEMIAQLKMIPTLDPALKSAKGLKNIHKKETFTSAKIASLIKGLQLKANKYDAAMEKFNNETTIDASGIEEEIKDLITA